MSWPASRCCASTRPQSIALADRALLDAEALAARPAIADLLITKGVSYSNAGRAVEGRALLEAGSRIADEDGLVLTGLRGRINLSASPAIEPRAGFALAEEGLEMARRIGNRRAEASLIGNYAFLALALGAWDELLAEVRGLPASVADSPVLLGNVMQVLAFRGEPVERAVLAASLDELDPAVREAILLDFDTNLALVTGRPADAIAAATRLAEVSSASAPAAFVVATHAAAWSGDLAALRRATGGLEATRVRGIELDAARIAIRAAIDALEGRRAESVGGLPGRPRPPRRPRPPADPDAASGSASRRRSAAGARTRPSWSTRSGRSSSELRALALADRLDEALARHGSAEQPHRSIGTPTMLPHSVQEPS